MQVDGSDRVVVVRDNPGPLHTRRVAGEHVVDATLLKLDRVVVGGSGRRVPRSEILCVRAPQVGEVFGIGGVDKANPNGRGLHAASVASQRGLQGLSAP